MLMGLMSRLATLSNSAEGSGPSSSRGRGKFWQGDPLKRQVYSGVEFIAVDNPHANKLTVHILAAVAQHEREMIAQRTKDALQAAKARGVVLGNPRLADVRDRAVANLKAAADRFAKNVAPIIREIQLTGVASHRGIARSLNARGVATARGGVWTAVQVSSILRCV